ncbi:MAG: ferritin-like domain-containing protein [Fimbriimonas sp.]
MKEAFEDLIKDIHNAEKQIEKALPKVIKKASDPGLVQALTNHLEETKNQSKMVEEVAKMCGFKHTGKVCHGMKGIIEEAAEHLGEKPGPLLDAMIISAAQKVEHYEICGYGTAKAWAQQLGYNEAVPMIEQIEQQEKNADQKLNDIAMGRVNQEAMMQGSESNGKKSSSSKSSSGSSKNGGSKSGASSKAVSSKSSSKSSSPRGKVSVR